MNMQDMLTSTVKFSSVTPADFEESFKIAKLTL